LERRRASSLSSSALRSRASRSNSAFVFSRLSLAWRTASFLMLSASFLASSTIRAARFSEDCICFRVITLRIRYPKAIPAISDAMAMMTGKKSKRGHLLIHDGKGRPMRRCRSFRFSALECVQTGVEAGQTSATSGGYSFDAGPKKSPAYAVLTNNLEPCQQGGRPVCGVRLSSRGPAHFLPGRAPCHQVLAQRILLITHIAGECSSRYLPGR